MMCFDEASYLIFPMVIAIALRHDNLSLKKIVLNFTENSFEVDKWEQEFFGLNWFTLHKNLDKKKSVDLVEIFSSYHQKCFGNKILSPSAVATRKLCLSSKLLLHRCFEIKFTHSQSPKYFLTLTLKSFKKKDKLSFSHFSVKRWCKTGNFTWKFFVVSYVESFLIYINTDLVVYYSRLTQTFPRINRKTFKIQKLKEESEIFQNDFQLTSRKIVRVLNLANIFLCLYLFTNSFCFLH